MKNTDKIVSITFASLLLVPMLFHLEFEGVKAQGTTLVYVEPSMVNAGVGQSFSIEVKVEVNDLAGYDFQLFWNTTILDCTAFTVLPPWDPYFVVANETLENYNGTHGRFWGAATFKSPAPAFSGNTALASLTFETIEVGQSALDLNNVALGDPSAQPIDGWYYIDSPNDGIVVVTLKDDLRPVNVEVVQVIQDAEALVVNKKTALRVDIQSTFSSDVIVPYIDVYYDFGNRYQEKGRNQAGILIKPGVNRIYIPGGPIYEKQGDSWVVRDANWIPPQGNDFFLKWTTTGTDDNIKAKVSTVPGESNPNNNENATSKKIVETGSLRILVVPVYFPLIGQTSFTPSTNKQRDLLLDIFPIGESEDSFSWQLSSAIPNFGIPEISPPALTLEDWLYQNVVIEIETVAYLLGYNRVVIVVNGLNIADWDGKAIGMRRFPEDRMSVIVENEALAQWDALVAHEIGHTYYLWHPNQDGGYGPDVIDAQIFRVSHRYYESTKRNLMRAQYVHLSTPWIDKQRYDSDPKQWIQINPLIPFWGTYRWNLCESINFALGPDPSILLISGNIFRNGTMKADKPWYRTDGVSTISSGANGNYTIFLLDESNQTLGQYSFNATFRYMTEVNGSLQERETDIIPFIFNIPYLNETVFIDIRNSTGQTLVSRAVSSNSPMVSVTSPNGGETLTAGVNHTISWDASDLDGDNLSFTVAYSQDGGAIWTPLAVDLNETSYSWNTSSLQRGSNFLVRVIATDGVNTGEDISDSTFTVLTHDVETMTIDLFKTVVGEGQNLLVNATVANVGSFVETFNVTLYANGTDVDTQTVEHLTNSSKRTIALSWGTTGFPLGNYTMSVYAWPVLYEFDTANNTIVANVDVCVTIAGDVDADFDVDIFDIVSIAGSYGSNKSDPEFVPNYDIDSDGDVDIFDVVIAAGNYEESW